MTFRPLADHVLIRRRKHEERTASGLVLPGAADKATAFADVVAVGPDVQGIAVGDVAAVPLDRSSSRLHVDGVEHEVVKADDILGVVDDGQAAKA